MCGICGTVNLADKALIQQMTSVLAHRGPDDSGFYVFEDDRVALGHCRLSIIDMSEKAHQPMFNDDRSLSIVYNGEIYNYKEIASQLLSHGHRFKSKSDTEVVLHAYQEWGKQCLDKMNGMFAFSIWDRKKKELFAARDRLGIKPFYYCLKNDQFAFGSEIKAILASKVVRPEADLESLHNPWHYQSFPNTGFKNIKKLPPGHYLSFSEKGLIIKKYWDIEPLEQNEDEESAIVTLTELLKDAVRYQMISDVPVGAFLSGGLDSSCIVALMSKLTDDPIRTFTIKFSKEDQKAEAMPDDSFYARKVAKQFGCDHKEIVLNPDVVDLLPKMVWHMDEPLADPAAINTYLISKAAREAGVIVLLNGMGGDEVFGGYRKHLACLLANYYHKIPPPLRYLLDFGINAFPVAGKKQGFKTLRWAKRFVSFASHPQNTRFLLADQSVPPELYKKLFQNAGFYPYNDLSNVTSHLKYLENDNLSYLTKMCLTDTKTFLPDHNLTYSDKATMAAGVEGRPPLIDHRIVEYMFKLKSKYRINGKTQKYLLKKSMESYLTKEIIYRPKAPFGAPLRSWIRGPLSEMIDDLLNPTALNNRGLYNSKTVWQLIKNNRKGKEDNAQLIWTILNREIWFRKFIDGGFP